MMVRSLVLLLFALTAIACSTKQGNSEGASNVAGLALALDPELQTPLREASRQGSDQLVAAAIRLADENPSQAPAIAAFAARLQPDSAGLLTVTMIDLFPESEEGIAAAIGSVMTSPAARVSASRQTGHTFFHQW